ncbi:MAG: HAMP domain-containing histidine kinase, partial [Elusimicrobia bacterium]|nr:HAMP domain-containing histidine kinase [Elusimicrobiota bacterium]
MSLKTKFFIAFIILGFTTLLVSSAGFYYFEYQQILKQQENVKISAFEKLFTVCKESEIEKNYIPAINFTKTLAKERYIVSARCVDKFNRIRTDTFPGLIGKYLEENPLTLSNPIKKIPQKTYSRGSINILEFAQIIDVGENLVNVTIRYNETYFNREIKNHLLHIIKQILSISLIVIIPIIISISFFLSITFTKPIYKMEQASKEFGGGNFDYQLEIPDTGDEISRLAKSLVSMSHKLSELDKLKQRFFANITHDLRSPLTAVHGYADMISEGLAGAITEQQSEGLKIILSNTSRLNEYIDDILDLAKLQSGAFEINDNEISIEEVINSVTDMFRAQTDKNQISLISDVGQNLPKIRGDKKLIHRCVANFISNAFKFTPKGGTITMGACKDNAGFLRIYVKDTGPGIPKDKLEFVFDKFFQVAENKDYAEKSGTGLGLTSTNEILQGDRGKGWG